MSADAVAMFGAAVRSGSGGWIFGRLAALVAGRHAAAGRARTPASRAASSRSRSRPRPSPSPAPGRARPPGAGVRNTGSQDDPEHRGHDLQRHLRLSRARGRGDRRGGLRPSDSDQPGLANPSRPIWIVDRPPGRVQRVPAQLPDGSGSPGGAVTAYSNTWALGPLAPGRDRQVRLGRDRGGARPSRRRLGGGRRAERQGQGGDRRRLAARTARSRSRSTPPRPSRTSTTTARSSPRPANDP